MGNSSSKSDEKRLFTEYEFTRLAQTFKINKNDLSTVTGDTFREIWSPFMVPTLMEIWIQYFMRNEFHYQFKAKFDIERFFHLYKDQTSPFIEVKAQGIIGIILGTAVSDRIVGISHSRVIEYFRDVLISYIKCLEHVKNDRFESWVACGCTLFEHHAKQMINHFVCDLGSTQGKVSELDLERWLRDKTFVDEVLGNLLDMCLTFHEFDEEFHPLLPIPKAETNTVLDVSHVLFLSAHLTSDLKKSWTLVYSSNTHGHNFTKFSTAVKDVGPTMLIVRETKGNLFGLFASESWKASPHFYGDSRCFLFQLAPNILIFEATGYNTNFMYHNFNQQTLANGFGMGGQLGFWGLWLDADFGKGRCENFCSTFKNYTCPSKQKDFDFDHLEVWAVDPSVIEDRSIQENISVLDKDPSGKAIMQMTSKLRPEDLL